MISQRRTAQLGLLATCVVLVSSFGILVFQGGDSPKSLPAPVGNSKSTPVSTPQMQAVVSPASFSFSSSPVQPAVAPLQH
jgi:hypothetical protein